VDRLLSLGDKRAINLMTHRSNISFLDLKDTAEEHRQVILQTGHSIYPVCEGSLDNIKGVVHVKMLLKQYLTQSPVSLSSLIQPVKYVNENSSSYTILNILRTSKIHQAVVIDEYGSAQGIITLNDILSDLIGDFADNDIGDKPKIKLTEYGFYLVDGQYQLDDFLSQFDLGLSEEDEDEIANVTTIAGLVFQLLDHVPEEGERVIYKGYIFEVIDMDGNRIDKLSMKKTH